MTRVTKMRLIRGLRSPDKRVALQAVEELRARGWLSHGMLKGSHLRYVHLQEADLRETNLQGADLTMANLRGADLSVANLRETRLKKADLRGADLNMADLRGADLFKANLQGARHLSGGQLAQAERLRGAIMPDGSLYDGCFNLAVDIAQAYSLDLDTNDPDAMAYFYGVSLEEYQRAAEMRSRLAAGRRVTKMHLIRKLRSFDNSIALQAVDELRARGWLGHGTLRGVRLRYVHLQGADLYGADLRRADLVMADLRGADLRAANLQGARLKRADLRRADLHMADLKEADLFRASLRGARHLSDEQLAQAKRLVGAIMPDGSLYDGRFNLAGDIEFARAGRVDIGNPTAMAYFYGVSLEEYRRGQQWDHREHLPSIWDKESYSAYTEEALAEVAGAHQIGSPL